MAKKCLTCLYYKSANDGRKTAQIETNGNMGACLRYPPKVIGMGETRLGSPQMMCAFPSVSSTMWCGEWKEGPFDA